MGKRKNEREIIDSLKEIKQLINENSTQSSTKLKITKWIDENKNFLIATGTVIAATAKVISWLIENTENVKLFLDTIKSNFGSPIVEKTLDVDSLQLFNKPLNKLFRKDNKFLRDFVKSVATENGFNFVYSEYYNFDFNINEL